MSVFKKICTGLLLSALSLTAQAGVDPGTPETQSPDQVPTQTEVNVSDTREVVQVLFVQNSAEIKVSDMAREKITDQRIQEYAERLIKDHSWMNGILEEMANIKSISLNESEMSETAQLISSQKDKEMQSLVQIPEEQFRSVFIEAQIVAHQKTLELFNRIEQGNSDDALKASIAIFRQMVEKHLEDAQKLKIELELDV